MSTEVLSLSSSFEPMSKQKKIILAFLDRFWQFLAKIYMTILIPGHVVITHYSTIYWYDPCTVAPTPFKNTTHYPLIWELSIGIYEGVYEEL